jgi:hypothetical protein
MRSEMSEYQYRLYKEDYKCFRSGKCEVCGEHADPLYLQVEERHYTTPNGSQRVTFSGCRQLYGHMECLVGARR